MYLNYRKSKLQLRRSKTFSFSVSIDIKSGNIVIKMAKFYPLHYYVFALTTPIWNLLIGSKTREI